MLKKFINDKYLDNSDKLKEAFCKAYPFPHLILEDFFIESKLKKVFEELIKEGFIQSSSDLFSFYQTSDLANSKNKKIMSFYQFLNSKEFKEFIFLLTNIKAFGKIDSSAFIYSSGDHLLPHDDRLENRKLAYVINFSNFTKKDGGSLDFFEGNKIAKSITPQFNNLIIFKVTKDKTYHQVSEVLSNKQRITIAGWFNDK